MALARQLKLLVVVVVGCSLKLNQLTMIGFPREAIYPGREWAEHRNCPRLGKTCGFEKTEEKNKGTSCSSTHKTLARPSKQKSAFSFFGIFPFALSCVRTHNIALVSSRLRHIIFLSSFHSRKKKERTMYSINGSYHLIGGVEETSKQNIMAVLHENDQRSNMEYACFHIDAFPFPSPCEKSNSWIFAFLLVCFP